MNLNDDLIDKAKEAVRAKSHCKDGNDQNIVKGFDFDALLDMDTSILVAQDATIGALIDSFSNTGFQATNLSLAIEEVKRMRSWRASPPKSNTGIDSKNMDSTEQKATIYLGYTSNMVSCGNREVIRFLVKHKLVDVIVTTAGGIEEDFIKCLAPTLLGEFKLEGHALRTQGMNRIGNLIVPNENYCKFEDWLTPILDKMVEEQNSSVDQVASWTPSSLIRRLGIEIDNEESIYFWAAKNNIPVFCPAITDGSLGDMIFFHSYKALDRSHRLRLDLVEDIRLLNTSAMRAAATGIICLGGGVVKHHICNANLMRNGADFGVFINTGHEYDGSDSGASPDEAVSWGKIRPTATPVKVSCDASIAFPLLVYRALFPEVLRARDLNRKMLSDTLYI